MPTTDLNKFITSKTTHRLFNIPSKLKRSNILVGIKSLDSKSSHVNNKNNVGIIYAVALVCVFVLLAVIVGVIIYIWNKRTVINKIYGSDPKHQMGMYTEGSSSSNRRDIYSEQHQRPKQKSGSASVVGSKKKRNHLFKLNSLGTVLNKFGIGSCNLGDSYDSNKNNKNNKNNNNNNNNNGDDDEDYFDGDTNFPYQYRQGCNLIVIPSSTGSSLSYPAAAAAATTVTLSSSAYKSPLVTTIHGVQPELRKDESFYMGGSHTKVLSAQGSVLPVNRTAETTDSNNRKHFDREPKISTIATSLASITTPVSSPPTSSVIRSNVAITTQSTEGSSSYSSSSRSQYRAKNKGLLESRRGSHTSLTLSLSPSIDSMSSNARSPSPPLLSSSATVTAAATPSLSHTRQRLAYPSLSQYFNHTHYNLYHQLSHHHYHHHYHHNHRNQYHIQYHQFLDHPHHRSFNHWSHQTEPLASSSIEFSNELSSMTPMSFDTNFADSNNLVATDNEQQERCDLLTNSQFLTIDQLKSRVRDETESLFQEFWSMSTNHTSRNELCISGMANKNRYKSILPNERTRVILPQIKDYLSTYINANYIRGYRSGNKRFIATQGPMPQTVTDFWRMVWHVKASAIVMLTKLTEKNKRKCEYYLPSDSGEDNVYEGISVRVSSISNLEGYAVRKLILEKKSLDNDDSTERLETTHYWFTSWPDHGSPSAETTTHLLELVDEIEFRGDETTSSSVVVHCSAGLGRTGCFIALCTGARQLYHENGVDLFAIVSQMRLDRGGLVNNNEQYEFLHRALLQYSDGWMRRPVDVSVTLPSQPTPPEVTVTSDTTLTTAAASTATNTTSTITTAISNVLAASQSTEPETSVKWKDS